MEWQVVVALMVAVPVILLPVVFVWYLNMGGILTVLREARAKRAVHKEEAKVTVKSE